MFRSYSPPPCLILEYLLEAVLGGKTCLPSSELTVLWVFLKDEHPKMDITKINAINFFIFSILPVAKILPTTLTKKRINKNLRNYITIEDEFWDPKKIRIWRIRIMFFYSFRWANISFYRYPSLPICSLYYLYLLASNPIAIRKVKQSC